MNASSPLLLCDLDDTLIDRRGAFRRWTRSFAAEHGLGGEAVAWLQGVDGDGSVDRHTFMRAVRDRFEVRPSVEALVAAYAARFPAHVLPPCAGGLAAIGRLKAAGWRVGVITNGPPWQVAKMRHAGLLELLDGWCISEVDGLSKPDPAIFGLAAERCGTSLEAAWMIGDSGPADIRGAIAAGLPSAWIHLGRRWSEAGYRPTLEADSLGTAITMIERRLSPSL
jgi:putative hydrolase of the HAD superfamily